MNQLPLNFFDIFWDKLYDRFNSHSNYKQYFIFREYPKLMSEIRSEIETYY